VVDELYARGRFAECLAASKGDASKALVRARSYMRLRRFRVALDELSVAFDWQGDAGATALALRLHCSAALGDSAEVTRLGELARTLQDVSAEGRAEIAIGRAYAAFYRGDAAEMRGALRAMNPTVAPRFGAWQLCLLSWAASLQHQYVDQALLLERMVQFIEETPAAMEVALLANAAQTLAELSREVFSINTFEFAISLAERIAWTPDLAEQRFLTQRSLAWAYALRGSQRRAQRMMHSLVDTAPSPQWRATIYGELAYFARASRSNEFAAALLEHAADCARATSWVPYGEERVGLLSLIELTAEHDGAASLAFLALYDEVGTGIETGLVLSHDRRLEAMEGQARAAVLAATGRAREAVALLERSFATFKSLGYSWRAASAALRLHALSSDHKWLKRASDAIANVPECALAGEIRRRETGSSDPRLAALTLTQQRAFWLVCEGMSDAQIADAMEVTINTARNHVAAVRQRFGAHSRAKVAAIARSSGLVV
jgi:DNA-binding CsgD family transcriptional regulator